MKIRPPLPPTYQPASQPNQVYNGATVPTAYDENWQRYTNLTSAQIAWFQAQPEWQNFLNYVALSPATAAVATPIAVVNAALQVAGKPIVVGKK